MAQYQVICTAPDGRKWVLTARGNWSYFDQANLKPATFDTRASARAALNKAYKHPADKHEVVQVHA